MQIAKDAVVTIHYTLNNDAGETLDLFGIDGRRSLNGGGGHGRSFPPPADRTQPRGREADAGGHHGRHLAGSRRFGGCKRQTLPHGGLVAIRRSLPSEAELTPCPGW